MADCFIVLFEIRKRPSNSQANRTAVTVLAPFICSQTYFSFRPPRDSNKAFPTNQHSDCLAFWPLSIYFRTLSKGAPAKRFRATEMHASLHLPTPALKVRHENIFNQQFCVSSVLQLLSCLLEADSNPQSPSSNSTDGVARILLALLQKMRL